MFGGFLESVVGVVLIVIPNPATTTAGAGLLADGVKRIAKEFS